MKFSIFDLLSRLEFYVICFVFLLLTYLFKTIPFELWQDQNLSYVLKNFWLLLPDYAVMFMMKLFSFSFFLSLILVVYIIWTSNRLMHIRREMHNRLVQTPSDSKGVVEEIVNEKWRKVVVHINSNNPSDWKLAILECDIMLGEILEKMGYLQPTIGDKLKAVEPSDFTNIEAAWEAHKIRNSIAHEGSEFVISQREAKRVIGLYESVFREFEYI